MNLRVSLHDIIMNFMLLKKFGNKTNEAFHTRLKSMAEPLKISGENFFYQSSDARDRIR